MSNQTQLHSRNVIENVIKNFDAIISATSVKSVLEHSKNIAKLLHYEDQYGLYNFTKLKNVLNVKSLSKWNRVSSILKTLDNKSQQKEYSCRNKIHGKKILVVGAGISGLRVSIELLLLGAKVICVEKRDEFTRNNVIHLWPNVINDLYTFEAKRFYGQFCVGSIDHVSIRQMQMILFKIAIIYGLKFYPNILFNEICPRNIEPRQFKCNSQSCDCCCHMHGFGGGAYAHFSSSTSSSSTFSDNNNVDVLNKHSFDVIIGCDGSRNTFSRFFPRNFRRGKLAIGLTANFVNRRTEDEARCPEISGISRIYNQKWFKDLQNETDIELENLVYYRDETHYFVMTATKTSLLKRGVLKRDLADPNDLVHQDNVDNDRLMKYSKDAAEWSSKLQRLEFALNSHNEPDIALFDFTSMYSATNASCAKKIYLKCCDKANVIAKEENFKYMLLLLCGDSLLEPFWPTGSGAGRGFLSALDAAWTVALWFNNVTDETCDIDSMLNVIGKRELVYRLLAQTSPENVTNKNFTLHPQTRYKNFNIFNFKSMQEVKNQVRHLIIDGADVNVKQSSNESKRARRATIGIDPKDIIKAKNLTNQFNDLNDQMSLSFHQNNNFTNNNKALLYAVPSTNTTEDSLSRSFCCDNNNKSPVEIINLKPKNFGEKQQSPQPQQHLDVQPRNNDNFSNLTKKNHHARNHFFNNDRSESYDQSSKFNINANYSTNHCTKDKFNTSHHSSANPNVNNQNLSNYGPSSSNKENYPIPDFKQMFDFEIGDLDRGNNKKINHSNSYKKTIDILNDPRSLMSMRDFEKSLNRKPKKSSDILEKAQHLAQKFEELNKPYVPNLSRVGKIEENDWNVKMWNSDDIFAPKQDFDKRNLVYENSKDLLQSRIAQLNNNIEYRKDLPKISQTNSRMSNDYVNMLSNEVCQKFQNNSNATVSNETCQKSLNENILSKSSTTTSDSIDSIEHKSIPNMKSSSEFLKPIGNCERCNKTLLAIDKVTISGHNFHRHCLTCKLCYVMLRQDEVFDEDFTCKICAKSRSKFSQDDPKSSFMVNDNYSNDKINNNENNSNNNSFNLSRIEMKKNFLVNVEHIDLRERAQFEIIGKTNDKNLNIINEQVDDVINEPVDDEDVSGDYFNALDLQEQDPIVDDNENADNVPDLVKEEEEEEQAQNEDDDRSSELTESDINYSTDNNYTDDENSDSDDFPSKASIKEDYGSGFTSLICTNTNTVDSDALADDSTRSSNAELVDLLTCDSDASSFNKISAPNNSNSITPKTEESSTTTATTTNTNNSSSSFRCSLDADSMTSYPLLMNSPCDNNVNLIINRENQPETKETFIPTPTQAANKIIESVVMDVINNDNDTNIRMPQQQLEITGKPLYSNYPRYPGQFTEKLFRSMSQPSLHDRLNLIDRKLKKKRSPIAQTFSQDLPFVDGASSEDAPMNNINKSTTTMYNPTKLTSAPFARIDDV